MRESKVTSIDIDSTITNDELRVRSNQSNSTKYSSSRSHNLSLRDVCMDLDEDGESDGFVLENSEKRTSQEKLKSFSESNQKGTVIRKNSSTNGRKSCPRCEDSDLDLSRLELDDEFDASKSMSHLSSNMSLFNRSMDRIDIKGKSQPSKTKNTTRKTNLNLHSFLEVSKPIHDKEEINSDDISRGGYSTASAMKRSSKLQKAKSFKQPKSSSLNSSLSKLDRFGGKSARKNGLDADDVSRGVYSTISKSSKSKIEMKRPSNEKTQQLNRNMEVMADNTKKSDVEHRSPPRHKSSLSLSSPTKTKNTTSRSYSSDSVTKQSSTSRSSRTTGGSALSSPQKHSHDLAPNTLREERTIPLPRSSENLEKPVLKEHHSEQYHNGNDKLTNTDKDKNSRRSMMNEFKTISKSKRRLVENSDSDKNTVSSRKESLGSGKKSESRSSGSKMQRSPSKRQLRSISTDAQESLDLVPDPSFDVDPSLDIDDILNFPKDPVNCRLSSSNDSSPKRSSRRGSDKSSKNHREPISPPKLRRSASSKALKEASTSVDTSWPCRESELLKDGEDSLNRKLSRRPSSKHQKEPSNHRNQYSSVGYRESDKSCCNEDFSPTKLSRRPSSKCQKEPSNHRKSQEPTTHFRESELNSHGNDASPPKQPRKSSKDQRESLNHGKYLDTSGHRETYLSGNCDDLAPPKAPRRASSKCQRESSNHGKHSDSSGHRREKELGGNSSSETFPPKLHRRTSARGQKESSSHPRSTGSSGQHREKESSGHVRRDDVSRRKNRTESMSNTDSESCNHEDCNNQNSKKSSSRSNEVHSSWKAPNRRGSVACNNWPKASSVCDESAEREAVAAVEAAIDAAKRAGLVVDIKVVGKTETSIRASRRKSADDDGKPVDSHKSNRRKTNRRSSTESQTACSSENDEDSVHSVNGPSVCEKSNISEEALERKFDEDIFSLYSWSVAKQDDCIVKRQRQHLNSLICGSALDHAFARFCRGKDK